MTKINHVYEHPSFETGNRDEHFFTDKPHMKPEEKLRMAKWIAAVLAGREHEGLNKPSWKNNGLDIPNAKPYKDNNVWHYHCGPYSDPSPGTPKTDAFLNENNCGKTGGEVYHYMKKMDIIIVLGFSKNHLPFPSGKSKKNPIRNRFNTWGKAIPAATPPDEPDE